MTALVLISFNLWRCRRLVDAGRIREAELLLARIRAAMARVAA